MRDVEVILDNSPVADPGFEERGPRGSGMPPFFSIFTPIYGPFESIWRNIGGENTFLPPPS